MSWEAHYDHPDDPVEITDNLAREGWELREQSEEGSGGVATIHVADPALALTFDGTWPLRVVETSSEATDNLLFWGYTDEHDNGREAGDEFEPTARAYAVQAVDPNTFWQRIVMRGSDCNRPAETDVERMEWLLGTSEAAQWDDVTTHFYTGSPVAMDAVDYRGQMVGQVAQDCAEAGGKNYWAKAIETGAGIERIVWYGKDSGTTYDSTLALSNDPADWTESGIDGTSLVWPVSEDTRVKRSFDRLVCGIYARYEGGATYRHNVTTHDTYGHRDKIVDMPNVKSLAKAQARADRMLAELGTPDIRVETRVRLPAGKASMLKAGMRVSLRLTHDPGFTTPKWCRVLSCAISPVAAGAFYDLSLELVPTGPPDPGGEGGGPFTGAAFAGVMLSQEYTGPIVGYKHAGDDPPSGWYETPTVGPISLVDGTEPFLSILVEQDMTLRIEAAAFYTTVATDMAVQLNVDSSEQGTLDSVEDTYAGALTARSNVLYIDIPSVDCVAGEIITVTGTYTGFLAGGWSNSGNNLTFLRVGRGTHNWLADGGPPLVWEGPS